MTKSRFSQRQYEVARQVMLHEEPFLSVGHSARSREDCSCFAACFLDPLGRNFLGDT